MKKHYLPFAMLMGLSLTASAANDKTTVKQVTDAIDVTGNTDYIITDATPFTTAGSVNIVNTEHAVVIIQSQKPSVVISKWLDHIYINGEKAVAGDLTSNNSKVGSNCQVKMYNRGAIIMPYGQTYKPLTCYTEPDFAGESCNSYTEGSSGGYMKSLTDATLNNNIKSFKLKRGYMVTFALGQGGWGYSRCFIADNEDLEINLPENMSGRVSSYRLFKWWNASKAGIHDTSVSANNALNTTSCFDWAQGNSSLLPDVEWVPNHIYEDWPSSSACGAVTGSCHMKTNNEPGNSADDHPQDVETVLNNWQNLMRTGMRLCSESSHDGSMSHLKTFIQEIDKRGWRCDLLDLHCYWNAGTFNSLTWYSNEYGNGRPIWISEWVWGSSWGHNGFWGAVSDAGSVSEQNQKVLLDNTKPILETMNANPRVERYYYWNSEAAGTHIWHDGKLTKLGEYYAKMETGLAYNASNEYIPKIVYSTPTDLAGTYNKAKGTFAMTWNDANGDMLDSLVVERKEPGASKFTWVAKVALKDQNGKSGASYSYTDTPEPGANYYRVAAYPIGNKTPKYSNETSVTVSSAKGNETFQYGKITVTNLNAITTDFSEEFEATPAVIMGVCSNKNADLYPGNLILSTTKAKFNYQILPWDAQSKKTTELTNAEEIPFMALAEGNGNFGNLPYEVGVAKVKQDTAQVVFNTPFPEGVTPIVITDVRNPSQKSHAIGIRTWDITNTGFKCIIGYEAGAGAKINVTQNVCYLAIAPGEGNVFSSVDASELIKSDTISTSSETVETDSSFIKTTTLNLKNTYKNTVGNLEIAAGKGDLVYGTSYRAIPFYDSKNDTLYRSNMYIFGGLQTLNYHANTVLRLHSALTVTEKESEYYKWTYGGRIKRMVDGSSSTTDKNDKNFADLFSWVVLSNNNTYEEETRDEVDYIVEETPKGTGIKSIKVAKTSETPLRARVYGRTINVEGFEDFDVFTLTGAKVNSHDSQAPGVYVVRAGGKSVKVAIK